MSDKLKVIFAPGAFDGFEGTQEDLDKLVANIQFAFESGDIESEPLDLDELQENDPEQYEKVMARLGSSAQDSRRN